MDCDTTLQALLYFAQLKSQRSHRQQSISVATKNKPDTKVDITYKFTTNNTGDDSKSYCCQCCCYRVKANLVNQFAFVCQYNYVNCAHLY